MKISQSEPAFILKAEDDARLTIARSNRGEPYRDGLTLDVSTGDYDTVTHIFLEKREAVSLRDFMNRIIP